VFPLGSSLESLSTLERRTRMSRFNFLGSLFASAALTVFAMAPTSAFAQHGGGGGHGGGEDRPTVAVVAASTVARLKAAIPTVDMRAAVQQAATRAAAKRGAGRLRLLSRPCWPRRRIRSRPWFILGESLELFPRHQRWPMAFLRQLGEFVAREHSG